jgi:predicted O-methyltransferase YrrM
MYVPRFVKSALGPIYREFKNDVAFRRSFQGFPPPLDRTMRRVSRTRFSCSDEHSNIPGWLTANERRALYALARWAPGPILEIGSWVGLSTTAIARGIKDSGVNKAFDTIDLNPTIEWFRPCADGTIGFYLPNQSEPFGKCSEDEFKKSIAPIVSIPGGPVTLLRKHLTRCGLDNLVSIHVGDFRNLPLRKYRFVFCDALHDQNEITHNAAELDRFLAPGSVLACHDIGRNPEYIAALRGVITLGHGISIDSLYIVEATADSC